MELKAAHVPLFEAIKGHVTKLQALEEAIAQDLSERSTPGSSSSGWSDALARVSELTIVHILLDILQHTFIPIDELDEVIADLTNTSLSLRSTLAATIQNLKARKTAS